MVLNAELINSDRTGVYACADPRHPSPLATTGAAEGCGGGAGRRAAGSGDGGRYQLQCGPEAAGVSCQSSAQEEQDPGTG